MDDIQQPTAIDSDFQSSTSWNTLSALAWTANVTRYAPIVGDIIWAGPRMVMKLGSLINTPESIESTIRHHENPTSASAAANIVRSVSDMVDSLYSEDAQGHAGTGAGSASIPSFDRTRGFGGVFNYATSRWALSCIAMSIILNRTSIYAATRRRLRFRWTVRLFLRIAPIILLAVQSAKILMSIQCQTSSHFSELRWGDPSKSSDLMFSHAIDFLNRPSSAILGLTDEQACLAVRMIPGEEAPSTRDLKGSLSLLWPTFGAYCLSTFLETLSSAVQGRHIAYETAMSLFEVSLAFAEADAAVSNQLTFNVFPKMQDSAATTPGNSAASITLTRSMIMKRVNTPPEVLFISLLVSMSHMSSHMLGLLDLQAKHRLVNTAFWAMSLMGTLVWTAFTFELGDPSSQGFLRFPTVCIIGLAPYILTICMILLCLAIYALAVLLASVSPPTGSSSARLTFRQRLAHAHQNMQASISLADIRVTREMDFYTAVLRLGYVAITMATEAVYLNEDPGINLRRHTWLDEARIQEAEELQLQWSALAPSARYDHIGAIGLIPVKGGTGHTTNGFSRERAAQKVSRAHIGAERARRGGLGADDRRTRLLMAFELFLGINRLLARLSALSLLWLMRLVRISWRPSLLVRFANRTKNQNSEVSESEQTPMPASAEAEQLLAKTDGLDVEAEIRRQNNNRQDEDDIDSDLYKYWLNGGWWGSKDASGDYELDSFEDEWDTTSVVSMSTNADSDDGWQSEASGQRTPTQRSPYRGREGSPITDSPLGMRDLARLLHPSNPQEREESRMLSAHLDSDRIMTRSVFKKSEHLHRTRILTQPDERIRQSQLVTDGAARTRKLNSEEEERLLEDLLLSKRDSAQGTDTAQASWKEGGVGLGSDAPQCVVCQSSPRSIIVWPCRCLSLCDDCRVSLAMNNFDKCVCCRREVLSFSRIYVP